eukprot:SRR837773.13623.p1 GENE.SRR837773.13623~~SRR837773.13623.p1  ORF type:complete len:546 (+),score=102.59 SRR837773.13623:320-1957(+)
MWRSDRDLVETELRVVLEMVDRVREECEGQRRQMQRLTQELGSEHDVVHDKANLQASYVEACAQEIESLQLQAADLREALLRQESEAAELRRIVKSLEHRARQEAERFARDHQKAEDLLTKERSERRRLEGVRSKLEQQVQSALTVSKDPSRWQAESKLLEVELRMRMESEVAESRRAVALLRAEFATEQAHRLCGGTSPSSSAYSRQASETLRVDDVRGAQVVQALAERERELASCRSEIGSLRGDVAAARERAVTVADDLSKVAADSIVCRQEMLAEQEKTRRLAEVVRQREDHIARLRALLGRCGLDEDAAGIVGGSYPGGDRQAFPPQCSSSSPPSLLRSSFEVAGKGRLEGLARGTAATVAALQHQVKGLSHECSPQDAGAGAGPGPSPLQARAVLALERQADRLTRRVATTTSFASTSTQHRVMDNGQARQHSRPLDEIAGSGGDEAAGAAVKPRLQTRPPPVPLDLKDSFDSGFQSWSSTGLKDKLSPAVQSLDLSCALDKAAGRLERLHCRLTGLSPSGGSPGVFDNLMQALSPLSR